MSLARVAHAHDERGPSRSKQINLSGENRRKETAAKNENGMKYADRLHPIDAEKRTRTSTPVKGLEPESSASANSAISAKEFKSMFFEE